MIITFKDACKYVGIVKQFFKIYLPATTATTVANIKNGIKLFLDILIRRELSESSLLITVFICYLFKLKL